jgi:hypothetical protein
MPSTSRLTVLSLAAATLALSFGTALSFSPEGNQTRAAQACRAQSVVPGSTAWELCLSHVTRAYEWDEIGLAQQLARAAGRADDSCRQYGTRPETPNYRACVSREIDAHSQLLILGDDQTGVNVAQQQ